MTWVVQSSNLGWYADDTAYTGPKGKDGGWSLWPPGMDDYCDAGTAQTMCDIFNARDYPEEFLKSTP